MKKNIREVSFGLKGEGALETFLREVYTPEYWICLITGDN